MSLWEDEKRFHEDKVEAKMLEYLLRDGEWYRIPKALLRSLSPMPALIFSFLLNQHNIYVYQERNKKYKKWFFCSRNKLSKELGISNSIQHRHLAKLRELGLIEYKMKGIPARRWIKINFAGLSRILQKQLQKKAEKDDPE